MGNLRAHHRALLRFAAVMTCAALASGCADGASSASTPSPPVSTAPAPPEPSGPQVSDHVVVTARIGTTEEFPDTLGLGSDFNDIFILFDATYRNVGTVDVIGIEGHLRLINAFGDETARVGFQKNETIRPGGNLIDTGSGLNFKRYECDMRQTEWCRALDSGFANYRLEAVVDRIALPGGQVITR